MFVFHAQAVSSPADDEALRAEVKAENWLGIARAPALGGLLNGDRVAEQCMNTCGECIMTYGINPRVAWGPSQTFAQTSLCGRGSTSNRLHACPTARQLAVVAHLVHTDQHGSDVPAEVVAPPPALKGTLPPRARPPPDRATNQFQRRKERKRRCSQLRHKRPRTHQEKKRRVPSFHPGTPKEEGRGREEKRPKTGVLQLRASVQGHTKERGYIQEYPKIGREKKGREGEEGD